MSVDSIQKPAENTAELASQFYAYLKKSGMADATITGYRASVRLILRLLARLKLPVQGIEDERVLVEYLKNNNSKRRQHLATLKRFLWIKGILRDKREASVFKESLEYTVQAYLQELALRSYKEATLVSVRCDLGKLLVLCGQKGIHTLDALSPRVADDFLAGLFITNPKGYCHNQKIKILYAVRGFFVWLYASGRTLYNLANHIVVPGREKKLSRNFFSGEEIERLFAVVDTGTLLGFMDRTIFEVLYVTGMRISELCGLTLDDAGKGTHTLYIREGKGGLDRYVPLGKIAEKYLLVYLENVRPRLIRQAGRVLHASEDSGYLFVTAKGERLTECVITRIIGRYLADAGISRRRTAHAFRYSCATHLLENGADIRHIAALLGHRKLDTTGLYAKVSKADMLAAIRCHPREGGCAKSFQGKYREGRKGRTHDL